MLGEEEEGGAAADDDEGADEDDYGRRRSRRSVGEPQRLAPSWGDGEEAPLPKGKDGSLAWELLEAAPRSAKKEPKKKGGSSADWTRAQLNALYTGLFAYGYGRAEAVHASSAALGLRTLEEVRAAIKYTTALALRTTSRPPQESEYDKEVR